MTDVKKFLAQLSDFDSALKTARRILVTAPAAADGDSIGAQLALRRMIGHRFPQLEVHIVNDELMPDRYRFLPDVEMVETPDSFKGPAEFDLGVIVDGGIDRAGRVKEWFDRCPVKVFIDHHAVSVEYPYTIRIVEPKACSTTELMYHLSQTSFFSTPIDKDFAQQIYLGLIFDTGFFRHSNTTPEAMELGAQLLRTGFDFTRVGERGMLERTFPSLQLLADTLNRAERVAHGKIIWSVLTQKKLKELGASDDDREGIIDQLFLTQGIDVALLFYELPNRETRLSLRSHGNLDVATFARSLTRRGGGHTKAAGANVELPMEEAIPWVLGKLTEALAQSKPRVE